MGLVEAWGGNAIGWILAHIIEGFYNLFYALTHTGQWLAWVPTFALDGKVSDDIAVSESLIRFIYYGASVELLFVLFDVVLLLTIAGFIWNGFMWRMVRALEGFANGLGRTFAWAGLIMVLLQIVIIFMQRVFAVSAIGFGFGINISFDVSWWGESLKFYNALIVTLCATYTFVQGGHVRVDLVYSNVSYSTKKVIDMLGSLFFMLPTAMLVWLFGWFFLWRHMVTPTASAANSLEQLMGKAGALKWNVETIGFSPNGFNAYVLFKVLLLAYIATVILQAVAFFYRSYLEWKEGPASEGKYLDKDNLGDAQAELVASIH